ncbi:alpha-glucan phosphorylase, H isozyme-like [Diospyros lotus]|uniref:alpha-glucan phosphorylase, H isozyme-like n=1 Tax=Diospyros lotus TaxID=55363 RepID=UPI0022582CF8|nr:alpha-glucan phosphorylase, H isozyme-like [Diospyros lotus]XP_052173719.1 alpha-glucan phosphorylase, H isozyme-like [Diospyros lotus]
MGTVEEVSGNTKSGLSVKSGVLAKIPAVAHPLAKEPAEIASSINYHAQYNPHFSLFKFEREQAFYATAESVCNRPIQEQMIQLRRDNLSDKITDKDILEKVLGRQFVRLFGWR